MLKAITAAALFAASTALFAQQSTPAPAPAAKERQEKMREAFKKARAACEGRQGEERRECMMKEMCASAKDPGKCEARVKERAQKMKERREQQGDKK